MNQIDLLINASILSDRNTGLGVYTYQLLENIVPILQSRKISLEIMCREKNFLPDNCKKYFHRISFNGYISRLVNTSLEYKRKYKLVWSTTQHGALFSRTNQIITIHDITPILYPKGRKHQFFYYKFFLPQLIEKSKQVFAVSESTKKDIENNYKVSSSKVFVGYESITKNAFIFESEESFPNYGIEKGKYFVIVGIHYEYKNIHSIVDVYYRYKELCGYKVLIIGNDNCEYANFLKKGIKEKGLENSFVFTGFVDTNTRNFLIKNSIALLFPSLYEGFGLPILESMSIGIPVFCSNVSSLPEIGGDAAIYFNPADIDSIGEVLLNSIHKKYDRDSLIEKGNKNAKRFDWNDISQKMANEIEKIIKD